MLDCERVLLGLFLDVALVVARVVAFLHYINTQMALKLYPKCSGTVGHALRMYVAFVSLSIPMTVGRCL